MKRFEFKFETLEKVRKSREDEAIRFLAEAQRAHRLSITYRNTLVEELEKTLSRRENLGLNSNARRNDYEMENAYIIGLKQRIQQAERSIQKMAKVEAQAVQKYMERRRDRMAVEKLHDNAREEYRDQRLAWEAKQMDELNVMRARLKKEIA